MNASLFFIFALLFVVPVAYAGIDDGGPGDTIIGEPSPFAEGTVPIDINPPEIPTEEGILPPQFPWPPSDIEKVRDPHVPPYPFPPPRPIAADKGDPLVFRTDGGEACTYRNWPEQHKSFLTEFDLLAIGENVTLSRTLCEGTMMLFIDIDSDGTLSNGYEMMYNQHDVYYSLSTMDENGNGFFDYSDYWWSIAMIKNGDEYVTPATLGILGFKYMNSVSVFNDMHGNGRYADCMYEGQYFYPYCVQVSSQPGFRIMAYNHDSVITTNGTYDSFGAFMGIL